VPERSHGTKPTSAAGNPQSELSAIFCTVNTLATLLMLAN